MRHGLSNAERLEAAGWDVTPEGCWEWRLSRNGHGYGQLMVGSRPRGAHRIAYEAWVGPIPEGMFVLHSCDNPPCINPEHLRVGTHQDNMNEMVERGRSQAGERFHAAKLTWADVREIRSLASKASQSQLAQRYGVDQSTISHILANQTWREPQEVSA